MVNVTCCGGQDRNTTVGKNKDMPPVETKNCYLSEGYRGSTFDYMDCAGAETACTGGDIPSDKGGCLACNASSGGGYCDIDGNFYSSRGMGRKFHRLTKSDDIAELTKSSVSSGLGEMNRLFERERQRTINRERNSEIRRNRRSSSSNTETTEIETVEEETTITDYITSTLLYIGVSATFIVMILSIVLILLK